MGRCGVLGLWSDEELNLLEVVRLDIGVFLPAAVIPWVEEE